MTFTVLAFSQLGHALAIRSERTSLFAQGLKSNAPMLAAVALTAALQMAALYVPGLSAALRTTALSGPELALSLAASVIVFSLIEVEKLFFRRTRSDRPGRDRLAGETERGGESGGA